MKLAVSTEASLCLGRLGSMFFQMGRLMEWERGRRMWQPRVANKTSFDPTAKYLILPDLMTPSYTNHIHSPNQPTATIIGNTLHAPGVQVSAGLIELASELKHLCRTGSPGKHSSPPAGSQTIIQQSWTGYGDSSSLEAAWGSSWPLRFPSCPGSSGDRNFLHKPIWSLVSAFFAAQKALKSLKQHR